MKSQRRGKGLHDETLETRAYYSRAVIGRPASVPDPNMTDKPQRLRIADRDFTSRLILGTGKFSSGEVMAAAVVAGGGGKVAGCVAPALPAGERGECCHNLTISH